MPTLSPLRGFAVLLALIVVAGSAGAQPPSPPPTPSRPPSFSPYLNLLRNGGSPALNYYGLVRPEQNLRQAVQGVQAGQSTLASNQRTLNDLMTGEFAPTGVPSQFFNHGGYFLNQRSGGGFGVGASPGGRTNLGTGSGPQPNAGSLGSGTGGTGTPPRR